MIAMKNNEEFQVSKELESYFQNKFSAASITTIPSAENFCIKFWKDYLQTNSLNSFQTLKSFYPQLHFPIQADINKTDAYINAVLKGKESYKEFQHGLKLNDVEGLTISVHESIAGGIPVVSVPDSKDFTTIVQSFLHKSNPIEVPESMGAFLASGMNNWARIHALKKQWTETNPFGNWNEEFSKNILPDPDLYKDKIIVLSNKPYSNVSAGYLGLPDDEWKAYSYLIRLEHECTHLYTLQTYGFASNNLHDELIADYIGIAKAAGKYNKQWMLSFMGLEDYPNYRKGARLQNYLESLLLSEENFRILTGIIKNAIETIAWFDCELGPIQSDKDQKMRIEALCETDLINIASRKGGYILMTKYNEKD